jgi:hypothetical protein
MYLFRAKPLIFLTILSFAFVPKVHAAAPAAVSSALSDQPAPLKFQNFPVTPRPIVEIGQNPFLSSGPIGNGFTIPTGAVWQPEFLVFGTARSAIQTFDNGKTNFTEFANRLDLFGNLYLTPTERILIGIRPIDRDGDMSSGYKFTDGPGTQNDLNANVRTLYFEGDFGEIFPNLDPNDTKSLDYGFSIGRQPLNFEDGIMINDDEVDAVGITRTSLFALGASAVRTTALFGWNDINRNDNLQSGRSKLVGLFTTADYAKSTVNVDLAYVNDPGADGFYAGLGSTQRFFGHLDTTFRVNTSVALDQESPAVSTGTLFFSQLSLPLPHGKDLVYLDTFWGIDDYSSAARDPNVGGPLGQVGLLFASQALGRYDSPLGNRANDSVGGALGWQHFIGGTDQQLTFEIGGRTNTGTPEFYNQPSSEAIAARYQLKLNQHCVLIFDTFAGLPEDLGTAYGLRSELLVKF